MATFGENLRKKRLELGLSQEKLAQLSGTTKQVISRYETGQREPKMSMARRVAAALGVDPYELTEWDDIIIDDQSAFDPLSVPGLEPLPKMRRVPIIGAIACGTPILAKENIESYARMPEQIDADFGLRCVGDSMIGARIMNGDIVYIKTDAEVVDGKIYAVLVNGDEATLKRVYRIGEDRLELRPENPNHPVQRYAGTELESVRIIGLAVAFTSAVR